MFYLKVLSQYALERTGRNQDTLGKVAGLTVEIRIQHITNTSLERYCNINLLYIEILEKLTVTQLVKKFPAFYGTESFITVFTRGRHRSLSLAR